MFLFSPITEKFTKDLKYPWYEGFDEERMSYVDDGKNIVVHNSCINLSQEENSQYIPFEMERYYQGIDLTEMMLQIYFVNSDSHANYDTPINVTYSDYYIRFGWLVDKNATFVSGKLTFEIRAIGTIKDKDGNTYDYVWKTRPNSQINIEKSLHGHEVFTPDENWYHSLVKVINEKSEKVEDDMHEAQLSEQHAKTSETNAKTSENKAKTSETNAAASAAASEQSAKNSQTSAVNSESSATLSRSWAVGGTGVRADEATNNAKYWCETTDALLPEVREEIRLDKEDLKSETQRATAAENLITNNLNSEISRSTSAESALSDKIALEESRAKSAESALSDSVNTEKTRAESAEQAITNNLNTEVIRASGVEESLNSLINNVTINLSEETNRAQTRESTLYNEIITTNTNLSTEISRAQTAESELNAKIDTANSQLSTKADTVALNSVVAEINTALSGKADNASVSALSTSVDALGISVKAVGEAVADKVDVERVEVIEASVETINTSIEDINTALTEKVNSTLFTKRIGEIRSEILDTNMEVSALYEAKSDWLQDNEAKPDYIKNKPFGYYTENWQALNSEVTLSGFIDYGLGTMTLETTDISAYPDFISALETTGHVKYIIDGVEYEGDNTLSSGTYKFKSDDGKHSVEHKSGSTTVWMDLYIMGDTHTFVICKSTGNVPVKISEEFMPDTVVYKTDLETKSDTSHTHTYVHIGTTAPQDTSILWVDPVNGLKYYDGTAWKYVIFGTEST